MKFSIQSIIWTLVILGIGAAAAMAFWPKPIDVETASVTSGSLRVSVQEDGKTRIREKYVISSPVAGRLSRIELDAGDDVTCDGEIIAVIQPADPAMLDARSLAQATARADQAKVTVSRSQSHVAQVEADHELDKTKFARAEKLIGNQAISQHDFDIARSELLASTQALRTAKFDAEIAQFELKMAEAALLQFSDEGENAKPFEVSSPISGKVLRVFQESATVVSVGTPLIEIGDPQQLEIEIDVLSTDAVRIRRYSEITIEHWGGQAPLQGAVRLIEPSAFTKVSSLGVEEQRVNVIADFSEDPARLEKLGDGFRVEARITIEDLNDVVMIPNSSLFRYQRKWHVFAIVNDTAEMRPVEIGAQNESHTQVLNGVALGDEVIVYPSDQVTSGTRIRRANGAPSDPEND